MVARDDVSDVTGSNVAGEIVDVLDQLARDGARLMAMVAEGAVFKDGVLQELDQAREMKIAQSC